MPTDVYGNPLPTTSAPGVNSRTPKQQDIIQSGINSINQAFSGFTPQFFQNRSQQYQNYAMPQLAQQYQQTRNQSVFDLANRGLSQSGAAQFRANQLGRELNTQRQNVVDTGTQQSQDLQRQVEQQRANLTQQFLLTGDPTSATTSALSSAAGFSQPSTFTPLANMFQNWANLYLANSQSGQGVVNPSLFYMNPLVNPSLSASRGLFAPLPGTGTTTP